MIGYSHKSFFTNIIVTRISTINDYAYDPKTSRKGL